MMEKMEAAKQQLRQDIESYTRGEEPSPIAMLRAALLEDWEVSIHRVGKEFKLVIYGVVRGLPDHDGGGWVCTGAVAWLDRKMRWARSHSRLYALGQPAGTKIPIEGVDV
ncbi:hypothetical protein [Bradyrhizobium diazoefficiens]|uniref:hypothetical protein n=1 Tax=Bradyrhizobium diazoefficiens TaxID=1355477 RepID=UPI0004B87012|nr:hypothetical protein [Bradyrhizobium diazoefficiens]